MVDHLRANGVTIDTEPTLALDFNTQTWVKDPDGNPIELMQLAAEFNALRNIINPQLAPLQPAMDLVQRGINFGGRVIQNDQLVPGLPESITEPNRIASSHAFVAGMGNKRSSSRRLPRCSLPLWRGP